MWTSMWKTVAATAAYAGVHSLFAHPAVKRAAAGLVGQRAYDALYRPFYNAQAIATLVPVVASIRRLPDRELYRARGPLALALRAGQGACLAYLGWAVAEMGFGRISGLDSLGAAALGRDEIPPAAEGQGPSPDDPAEPRAMLADGPFRFSRHPLNVASTAALWLNPRMTANLLAFNLAATAYFVLGSMLEERRLARAYGPAYAAYRGSGVRFFVPGPPPAGVDGPVPAGRPVRVD